MSKAASVPEPLSHHPWSPAKEVLVLNDFVMTASDDPPMAPVFLVTGEIHKYITSEYHNKTQCLWKYAQNVLV